MCYLAPISLATHLFPKTKDCRRPPQTARILRGDRFSLGRSNDRLP